MKTILVILSLFITLHASCQLDNGVYQGLESMKGYGDGRWYHLNTVYVRNDSVFLYKEPIHIRKKDTVYSASDGAFYYYFGKVRRADSVLYVWLARNNCDYCARKVRVDTVTGFYHPVIDTVEYRVRSIAEGFVLNGVPYKLKSRKLDSFPERLFYFDENSIYRMDPPGQYKLMAQGIRDFLRSDSLRPGSDTLYVCTDRIINSEPTSRDSIIEKLDPALLDIHYKDKIITYLSSAALQKKVAAENLPCRCIRIGEIIDYKKAARIELTYKIILPGHLKGFSERQYHAAIEYNKQGDGYILAEEPYMGFELIEK